MSTSREMKRYLILRHLETTINQSTTLQWKNSRQGQDAIVKKYFAD